MANKATKQQIQDAMWDRVTIYGTHSAMDSYAELHRIKQNIDPCESRAGAAHEIMRAFTKAGYSKLPSGDVGDVCDAFADLEAELYEAKEAELMKGY